VAQQTQKQLEFHISEIVTLAMSAVFDEPYSFKIDFVQRRNKTEADLWFVRDGEQFRPLDASGGGAVDVAAFALRVAMWSLRRPRSRATLILDEPLKMLSRDLMPKAASMIAEVSRRLGLQIILVSHSEELIEKADKTFRVFIKKGISEILTDDIKLKQTITRRRRN
jgi:DNA repair exonuclease SbcCD ATPase subunit